MTLLTKFLYRLNCLLITRAVAASCRCGRLENLDLWKSSAEIFKCQTILMFKYYSYIVSMRNVEPNHFEFMLLTCSSIFHLSAACDHHGSTHRNLGPTSQHDKTCQMTISKCKPTLILKYNASNISLLYHTVSLQWRHNGRDSVSNHQPHYCLLNSLFRRRSKKTSKLRVTGLCEGNSLGTEEFPAQMASNVENVSIWWRHHVTSYRITPFHVIHDM